MIDNLHTPSIIKDPTTNQILPIADQLEVSTSLLCHSTQIQNCGNSRFPHHTLPKYKYNRIPLSTAIFHIHNELNNCWFGKHHYMLGCRFGGCFLINKMVNVLCSPTLPDRLPASSALVDSGNAVLTTWSMTLRRYWQDPKCNGSGIHNHLYGGFLK